MAPVETKHYDYIVIGGGSGGSGAARRASGWYGKKTALISAGVSGGCCVNVGCVPKKITWNFASINEMIDKSKHYHYDTKAVPFDFRAFVEDRDARIKTLNGAYESNWKKDGIDLIHAHASFTGKEKELEIKPNDGSAPYKLTADHICIATGSYPTKPSGIEGSEHGITSDDFFLMKELPKKYVFVGGGYIAVELAGMMASIGVDTTLILRGNTFLRKFDPIVQDVLTEHYEKTLGVKIIRENSVKKVELLKPAKDESDPREKELLLTLGDGSELRTNELLWAIGRGAETRGLGLDKTNVELDKTGHVVVDKFQDTSVSGIYALGDICGQAELTPVAIAAGRQLGNRLFGPKEYSEARLDYDNIPTVVFSHPTVGTTGITEPEAVKRFGKENVKVYEARFSSMFFDVFPQAEKKAHPTVFKMIVHGKDEQICGLHILGEGCDEMMQGFGVAVKMGARKRDFDSTVAIHPTSAEELVTMAPGMAREARA